MREKERICILLCVIVLAIRSRLFLEVNDGVYIFWIRSHTRESFVSKVTILTNFVKILRILTYVTASDLLCLI